MALDSTWGLHSVKFTHGSAPTTFTGITRRTITRNVRTVTNFAPGMVQPSYVAVMTAEPMLSFETTEISRVLTAIGLNGVGLGADGSDTWTGVEAYYVKKQNKGTRVSGSNHIKHAGTFAFACIRRIRARWGAEATAEVEIYIASTDGENQPLAVSTGVSLATIVVDQKFTLGYAALNGVEIDPSEIEIDFGKVVEVKGSGADIYATNINLKRHSPVCRVKTFAPELYATHDLDGTAISASHCDFYLRKMSNTGARVADATAEHIRFRFLSAQGMIIAGDDSGSESDDVEADFSVVGITDGTNESVAITNGIVHP